MKIRGKLASGFAAVVALSAIIGGESYTALEQFSSGVEVVKTNEDVVGKFQILSAHINEFEATHDHDLGALLADEVAEVYGEAQSIVDLPLPIGPG